jgi:outer membrane lipoprotein-sorting protein
MFCFFLKKNADMKKILLILLFLYLSAPLTYAAGCDSIFRKVNDTATLKRKLRDASSSMVSLEARFVQKKQMEILTSEMRSEGILCFKEGNKVRWEYTSPFSYLIIINDGKMFISSDGKSQQLDLTSDQAFLQINSRLSNIMTGNVLNNSTDFTFSFFENDTEYKISMLPFSEQMKSFFSGIDVFYDKKMLLVSRLIMREKSGSKTDITFFSRKLNQPVDESKFRIK